MRKTKFIFPVLFIIALAGSAFTQQSKFAKKGYLIAYYENPWQGDCSTAQLIDAQCVSDPTGYTCTVNIIGSGSFVMYQYGLPGICYQPYYSYTP